MKTIYFILALIFLVFISCQKESTERRLDSDVKFVPTDVIIKTKGFYTIDKVFEFINSFDHKVESITYGFYTSTLPIDSLKYVLDYLKLKPYTHNGERGYATGYVTNEIIIFPKLFNMENKGFQADWLHSMEVLKLAEKTDMEVSGNTIFFHVPIGKEKEWVEKFKKFDFVEWAELNYIFQVNPWP